jgi:hypothetical protein
MAEVICDGVLAHTSGELPKIGTRAPDFEG